MTIHTLSKETYELNITRSFKATPEAVFRMFKTVDALKAWFGPDPCRITEGQVDFRKGGAYALKMSTPMGDVWVKGHYQDIRENEHISYTFQWSGNPEMDSDVMHVTYDFSLDDFGHTKVILRQTGFESAESRDNHHHGWNGSFDRLLVMFTMYQPGRFCWNEIATNDPARTKAFYSALFGWQIVDSPDGRPYGILMHHGEWIGGLLPLTPEMGPMPNHWGTYIMVENLEASLAKATELGARTLVPPMPVGQMGRLAAINDPTGATICFWQALSC